jgi:hypothetical protein
VAVLDLPAFVVLLRTRGLETRRASRRATMKTLQGPGKTNVLTWGDRQFPA